MVDWKALLLWTLLIAFRHLLVVVNQTMKKFKLHRTYSTYHGVRRCLFKVPDSLWHHQNYATLQPEILLQQFVWNRPRSREGRSRRQQSNPLSPEHFLLVFLADQPSSRPDGTARQVEGTTRSVCTMKRRRVKLQEPSRVAIREGCGMPLDPNCSCSCSQMRSGCWAENHQVRSSLQVVVKM